MSQKRSVMRINRDFGLKFGNIFKNRQSKITQFEFSTNLRKKRAEDSKERGIYSYFGQMAYNK